MEVGAVKQAFNNEVILLKKKLNQAKIQVIHKLTRKAKTLTEKKVPEKLKAKFTKKAESAVKEVLILKKIKTRDVAKFIVTHKGQLNEYLNRPTVDQDKACARLLLHKALQDKYKVIRERFSNISINDLLMSRQERRKLKKEARDNQKNKKKGKESNELAQSNSDWDVEDINMNDSNLNTSDKDVESSGDEHDQDEDEDDDSASNVSDNDVDVKSNDLLKNNESSQITDASDKESDGSSEIEADNKSKKSSDLAEQDSSHDDDSEEENVGKFVKLSPNVPDNSTDNFKDSFKKSKKSSKRQIEKHKDKNKNLMNKILLKKFKKDNSEVLEEKKVVDPFFITATGENYMSVADPRPPDEVKEVHKEGNRRYRRAVMFGHAPKPRARKDDFRQDSNNLRFNQFDDNSRGRNNSNFKSNGIDRHGPQKRFEKSFDSRNDFKHKNDNKDIDNDSKDEKLHPSWEAKKRQSGLLPFQGKKIVFDEG